MENSVNAKDYYDVLTALKAEIKNARLRAHLAVNNELIMLYWRIGKTILGRQEKLGWGSKVIEQLSLDLKHEFPEIKGFGAANLYNMRRFAGLHPDGQFLQQVAGELPWYHHVVLMERNDNLRVRSNLLRKWKQNTSFMRDHLYF